MSSTALMVYGGAMFLVGACVAWGLCVIDTPDPEPPPPAKYRADEPHDCTARPAGKLVKRLMEQGVVKYVFPPKGSKEPTRYTLTEKHERSET